MAGMEQLPPRGRLGVDSRHHATTHGPVPRRTRAVLVVSQSMRPIAFGVLVGGGLAAITATVLLATPAAEGIGLLVRAFDPLAYASGLGVIIATCLVAA